LLARSFLVPPENTKAENLTSFPCKRESPQFKRINELLARSFLITPENTKADALHPTFSFCLKTGTSSVFRKKKKR